MPDPMWLQETYSFNPSEYRYAVQAYHAADEEFEMAALDDYYEHAFNDGVVMSNAHVPDDEVDMALAPYVNNGRPPLLCDYWMN